MFGCCKQAMSITYIDNEGNFDPEYIKANYPEGSKVVDVQDTTSGIAQYHFRSTGEYPSTPKVVSPDGAVHDICRCPCHGGSGAAVMC